MYLSGHRVVVSVFTEDNSVASSLVSATKLVHSSAIIRFFREEISGT